MTRQDKGANFRDETGNLYLVRCYVCGDAEKGRENALTWVSSGACAWCGWSEEVEDVKKEQESKKVREDKD